MDMIPFPWRSSSSGSSSNDAAIRSMSPAEALMGLIQGPDGLKWQESRTEGWQDDQDPNGEFMFIELIIEAYTIPYDVM
jgi:hypothetical protein